MRVRRLEYELQRALVGLGGADDGVLPALSESLSPGGSAWAAVGVWARRLPRRLVALVVLLNRVASECVCRLVPLVESDLIDEHRYLHQITAMGSGGGSGGHQEVAEVVAKGDRDNGDNSNGSESS